VYCLLTDIYEYSKKHFVRCLLAEIGEILYDSCLSVSQMAVIISLALSASRYVAKN